MKIIFKKPIWFTVITTLCLVGVTLFATVGCDKSEIPPTVCNFDNPLTDLPWLKEKIDEFNLLAQENQSLSIAIYQCKYGNEEIGFLVDNGNTKPFYNCKGEVLCIMDGDAGETCSELNIVSEELIWNINNDDMNNSCEFGNPLTDLLWMKTKVDEITLLFQVNPLHIAIYQCTYGDGKTGFLEDRGNIAFFYNCEGETLCIMGGDAGETCSELNIVNKELIWEINN